MAIGKCQGDHDIDQRRVRISFGDIEVDPQPPDEHALHLLVEHLKGDEVLIRIDLGIGNGRFTVYGCDLTEGYIRINSSYTT